MDALGIRPDEYMGPVLLDTGFIYPKFHQDQTPGPESYQLQEFVRVMCRPVAH